MGLVRPRPAMVMGGLEDRKIKARLAYYDRRRRQLLAALVPEFEAGKQAAREATELRFNRKGVVIPNYPS